MSLKELKAVGPGKRDQRKGEVKLLNFLNHAGNFVKTKPMFK